MFSADTTIGGWTFNAGAPDYTFTNDHNLAFTGAGISGGAPAIINNSTMSFDNTGGAGSASINNNLFLNFFDGSTAGSAAINNSGTVSFFGELECRERLHRQRRNSGVRRQEHGQQRRHNQQRR